MWWLYSTFQTDQAGWAQVRLRKGNHGEMKAIEYWKKVEILPIRTCERHQKQNWGEKFNPYILILEKEKAPKS